MTNDIADVHLARSHQVGGRYNTVLPSGNAVSLNPHRFSARQSKM
jgi:hypothetical protein